MKYFIYVIIVFTFLILNSCGTTKSLNFNNQNVVYAKIIINDSLIVMGPIIDENDKSIEVVLYGVSKKFEKDNVKTISKLKLADDKLMQEDIVKNTARTTNFLFFSTFIGIISAIFILVQ
jgi:hypothetical protein